MVSRWRDTTIGNQVTLQRGIDITKAEQRTGEVPVVSSGGISSYHDVAQVRGPGVILGRKGVVGSVYYVEQDYWPHDTTLWVKEFHGNEPRFVYYFFKQMASRLAAMDVGSANPTLNRNHVHPTPISWPPLSEQRAIASVLGTLDDKIELNRRMNETLEEMARALFKSWFVDFDPVRAKMEGRQPAGMDDGTANLFPDAFEDSPLGEIPKGWRMGVVEDLVILQRGFDLPKKQRALGPYPVLAASGPSGTHVECKVEGPGVTTGRSGVLGKVFFVHDNYWPLNTSLWVKQFDASRPLHAYHFLSTLNLKALNAGSAVPTLNRNHVHNLPALIPDIRVIEAFEELAMPMFSHHRANSRQSETLAALRDALLPKLLSGEVRVGEAEEVVEGAL